MKQMVQKNFIISCRQRKIIPYCNVHCFTIGIVILLGLQCETLRGRGGGHRVFLKPLNLDDYTD